MRCVERRWLLQRAIGEIEPGPPLAPFASRTTSMRPPPLTPLNRPQTDQPLHAHTVSHLLLYILTHRKQPACLIPTMRVLPYR